MNENKFEYVIKESDQELHIKELLKRNFGFSSRLLRRMKYGDCVRLNGALVKMNQKGQAGDRIAISLPEEESGFEPEPIPISVIYEDEDLLIIDKQPGYVVHPTKGHPCHTMANGVMNYMLENGKRFKIRFINRLDMDTTGLLAIAKNSHCQDDLSRQMAGNGVVKKYVAVVKGLIEEDEGTVDLPIDKEQEDHLKRTVVPGGYPSVTHYKVLERFEPRRQSRTGRLEEGYTLVELVLETGRTHQIRVHMSHMGHSVVGDVLYGEASVWLIERQALHAAYLSFRHPVSGRFLELEAPLPRDMQALLEKIR